jgi:hypothetical protein
LEAADVASLIPTPGGFALLGTDYRADGSAPGFLISGSADGSRWSQLVSPTGPAFDAIAGNELGWVAETSENDGTTQATTLWVSADGSSWVALPPAAGLQSANLHGFGSDAPITAGPRGFAIVGTRPEVGGSVADVWISRDGMAWAEATALKDRGFDQVLVLPNGFVAIANGCCVGFRGAAFSSDGLSWHDLSIDQGPSPDTADESGAMVEAIGSTLAILRPGPGGDVEVITVDLANAADQASVSWERRISADATFTGAGISGFASSGDRLLVLGYDRETFDPITWTSNDAIAWHRTELDAGAFGGGVPHQVALSGAAGSRSITAVGYRTNGAGDTRRQLWRSDDGATWSETGGDLLGVPPVAPTGPCPATTPIAVEDFLAMPPALWPRCFGDQVLRIRGVTAECGCGGVTTEQGSPAWLIDPLGYSDVYLSPRVVAADTGIGGLTIRINPANPLTVPPAGTYVELTGHFADPAAATCRIHPNSFFFGPVPPRGAVVARCEQTFVVTGIRTLPG